MSILNGSNKAVANSRDYLTNTSIYKALVPEKGTKYPQQDFPDGLVLTEIVNGKLGTEPDNILVLNGNMMPFQPLSIGGEQRITKKYYPGNPEPAVQVLGSQEKDIVIKGRLKDRKYKDASFRGVADEVRQKIENMRIRGNILEMRLGEIVRYIIIKETEFNIKTLADIEYQITFDILGFTQPDNFNKVDAERRIPFDINEQLLLQATSFQQEFGTPPETLPQSLIDNINGLISDVASAISAVTGYIDSVVSVIEDVAETINKAVGVIRFAQLEIFRFRQRLGRISLNSDLFIDQGNVSSIGGISAPDSGGVQDPTLALKYSNANYIGDTMSATHDLTEILENMRSSFIALQITIPLARHRVKAEETLQTIALKYYDSIESWDKIKDHNKLESTVLEVGSILEIPRL